MFFLSDTPYKRGNKPINNSNPIETALGVVYIFSAN